VPGGSTRGRTVIPLDEAAVERLAEQFAAAGIEASRSAICIASPTGARERTCDILAARLPGVTITLSSEVSPEMREYERFSTAGQPYVQPMLALSRQPRTLLRAEGSAAHCS
jgi:N-methylhydantoinase A